MRRFSDKVKVLREKFTYICDSTSVSMVVFLSVTMVSISLWFYSWKCSQLWASEKGRSTCTEGGKFIKGWCSSAYEHGTDRN